MRRKLLEVRKEFEDVVNELEKDDTNFVCWKGDALGFPLINPDPKVLNGVNEQKNLDSKENNDEILKHRGSVNEGFVVKLTKDRETTLKAGHCEQVDGERSAVDEKPILESSVSGASNSGSFDYHYSGNQGFRVENGCTSVAMQGHKLHEEMISPGREQSPREITSHCPGHVQGADCPGEIRPRRILDSPIPLNSTMKKSWSRDEEMKESVGRDSTSETSLHSYLQQGPHLREDAHLSDTWLTDRSFGKLKPSIPASPPRGGKALWADVACIAVASFMRAWEAHESSKAKKSGKKSGRGEAPLPLPLFSPALFAFALSLASHVLGKETTAMQARAS